MQAYVCEGNSGKTYGIHVDGTTYIQIQHPSGKLGSINELEQYSGWSLERWKGQMGAEKCAIEEIPEELSGYLS